MALEQEDSLDNVISDLVDEDDDEKQPPSSISDLVNEEDIEVEGPPVQLTERGADQVRHIREQQDLDNDLRLRVAVEGGGCSGLSYKLGFDYPDEDDKTLISSGVEITVDPKHMMYLKGIVVDYPDGLDARGFTFDNPNASETCGCGSSFAT